MNTYVAVRDLRLSIRRDPFPTMSFLRPQEDKRVFNLTTNRPYNRSQAKKRIEAGLAEWVNGNTFRDLTLQETMAIRSQHRDLTSGLPPINPGDADIREVMPRSAVWTAAVRYEVLGRAREFYWKAIQ